MGTEQQVALIAAVSGALGVVFGGGITYLSNRELQDRETERQDRLTAQVARTAAAVERHRLGTIGDKLQVMVVSKQALPLLPVEVRAQLTTEQLGALVAAMSPTQSETYQNAGTCIGEAGATGLHAGRSIDPHIARALDAFRACIVRGEQTLTRFVVQASDDDG